MAKEEFKITGLSPSHAFTLMIINFEQGISQKELSKKLSFDPSTITRFVDVLERKKLIYKQNEGKISYIFPTKEGKELQNDIKKAHEKLYDRYSKILGYKSDDLAKLNYDIASELEKIL